MESRKYFPDLLTIKGAEIWLAEDISIKVVREEQKNRVRLKSFPWSYIGTWLKAPREPISFLICSAFNCFLMTMSLVHPNGLRDWCCH